MITVPGTCFVNRNFQSSLFAGIPDGKNSSKKQWNFSNFLQAGKEI